MVYNKEVFPEVKDVVVKTNDIVKGGQLIGHVETVLNVEKINSTSPKYIKRYTISPYNETLG